MDAGAVTEKRKLYLQTQAELALLLEHEMNPYRDSELHTHTKKEIYWLTGQFDVKIGSSVIT
jgi:hypothetical protein